MAYCASQWQWRWNISCFKQVRPCPDEYKVLKEQMTILKDEESYKNTFEMTDSDVEDA